MKKENLPVIIAIALPVLLILVVAAFVYIPNSIGRPQYNFIYTQTNWPYSYSYNGTECLVYKSYYEIEGNRLIKKDFAAAGTSATGSSTSTLPRDMNYYGNNAYKPMIAVAPLDPAAYCAGYSRVVKKDAPELYIYESAADSTRLLPYEEASKLTLVDGMISPDGYTVQGGYQSSGLFDLFGGGNGYELYAMKKDRRVKLSVPQFEMYGGGNFGFISWINKY